MYLKVTLWDCKIISDNIRMTWFRQPYRTIYIPSRCSESQWRLPFYRISSCFQVQNNAGECHRILTFFFDICTNTTTSKKCCKSVTRDYPSCTIMSALLPLQRIAGVSLERLPFLHNYVCTNTTTSTTYCSSITREWISCTNTSSCTGCFFTGL